MQLGSHPRAFKIMSLKPIWFNCALRICETEYKEADSTKVNYIWPIAWVVLAYYSNIATCTLNIMHSEVFSVEQQ